MKKMKWIVFSVFVVIFMTQCKRPHSPTPCVELFPVADGSGSFQYIDGGGAVVINPIFRDATVFREGLALVQTAGDEPLWGYISSDGNYVINPQYKRATVFSDGLAWVVTGEGHPTAIDRAGKVIFSLADAQEVRLFQDGLAAYSTVVDEGREYWGFVNKKGEVAIPPQFSGVGNFSSGMGSVRDTLGRWGYIDKSGELVIEYQFDYAYDFDNDRAVVALKEKHGVINREGRYMITPQFNAMLPDGDLFLFEENGLWGWCDHDGEFVINPQFISALPFAGENLAPMKSGNSWGYVDRTGKWVIKPNFDMAYPFSGGKALVKLHRYGFIDTQGKLIINPKYDRVSGDLIAFCHENIARMMSAPFIRNHPSFHHLRHLTDPRIYSSIRAQMQVGIRYEKSLTQSHDEWGFYLEAGTMYSIDMISGDFDAKLEIYNNDNVLVAEDDDGGEGQNARILITPPSAGYYTVYCRTYAGGSGKYSLKVQVIPARTLEMNTTVQGTLSRGSRTTNEESTEVLVEEVAIGNNFSISGSSDNLWIVYLEASKSYEINLMSDAFDAHLTLLFNGGTVATDDDGGSGTNSKIRYTPRATGYHTVVAGAYNNSGYGRYRLSIHNR